MFWATWLSRRILQNSVSGIPVVLGLSGPECEILIFFMWLFRPRNSAPSTRVRAVHALYRATCRPGAFIGYSSHQTTYQLRGVARRSWWFCQLGSAKQTAEVSASMKLALQVLQSRPSQFPLALLLPHIFEFLHFRKPSNTRSS